MPASISAHDISVCSLGATVPWPPVTNILMISAPRLISSRTARRNSSGPSDRLMAPWAPTSQYQGKLLSPACPVVLTSRLPAIRRGPGNRPSAMAAFMDASMAKGAPALTAPVNPRSQQQLQVVGGADGLEGRRLLEPEGRHLRAELVVGGVEVATDESRHDGPAGQLDHTILGPDVDDGTTTAYRSDPSLLDHDGRAGAGAVRVEDGGAHQHETWHEPSPYFQPAMTCSNHHGGAAATKTFMSQ